MNTVIELHKEHSEARDEVSTSVNAFIARAGVSKSQVARDIGMSQSKFSRRTTGDEPFDVDELGSLADYFGVTLVQLITGEVTQIPPNAKKGDALGRQNCDLLIHWSGIQSNVYDLDTYRQARALA